MLTALVLFCVPAHGMIFPYPFIVLVCDINVALDVCSTLVRQLNNTPVPLLSYCWCIGTRR